MGANELDVWRGGGQLLLPDALGGVAGTLGLDYWRRAGTVEFPAAISNGGRIKVWLGSSWVEKPIKEWTGAAWVQKPLKVWNGTVWVQTK